MSIGVWVGLIALLGVDAETGVFMLLYLDLAYEKARQEGRLSTLADLRAAIMEGAAKRIRPKFMTVATTMLGLVPIMWSTGTGADVMKHIAAPMVGGILTSFLMELMVYPAIYEIWKWNFEMKRRLHPGGRTVPGREGRAGDMKRNTEAGIRWRTAEKISMAIMAFSASRFAGRLVSRGGRHAHRRYGAAGHYFGNRRSAGQDSRKPQRESGHSPFLADRMLVLQAGDARHG